MSLHALVPWYVKIALKVVLARLPLAESLLRRLPVFRAASLVGSPAAFAAHMLAVYRRHLAAAGLDGRRGLTVVELGPGDSLLSALHARVLSDGHAILIDAFPIAARDAAPFRHAAAALAAEGLAVPPLPEGDDGLAVLAALGGRYHTGGLDSLRALPAASVDFLFSHMVLEHVRLAEVPATLAEMRRVLKPDGVASHVIDFRDHLQYGLNNLRFSEAVWESGFMASSGFYTNRIPWPDLARLCAEAGLSVTVVADDRWPGDRLPTPQTAMAAPFRDRPAADLMHREVHVLLRPIGEGA